MPTAVRGFRRIALSALAGTVLGTSAAPAQSTYEVVHAFRNSGQPSALIRGSDGYLYGATSWGGTHGAGSIFRVDSQNRLVTLHSFGPYPGGGPDTFVTLMQASTGDFYGTTNRGGENGVGTVFRMDASGTVVTLHNFNGTDGARPHAPLIEATDGNFYGTTPDGGPHAGTVFKMDPFGNLATLHGFDTYVDGAMPYGGVIQGSDQHLYGTTYGGGPSNLGTVYRMDLSGNVTTLHTFVGTDGSSPYFSLLQSTSGELFGTTSGGGTSGKGTVFKINSSGDFFSIHSFDGSDGAYPVALVQEADGTFCGVAGGGGANNSGTAFQMTSSGEINVLHNFDGSDGSRPVAPLVPGSASNFYGITQYGGSSGVGVVFLMEDSGSLTTLLAFENLEPGLGTGSKFLEAADGTLYATSGSGVFRMDLSGNLTLLHTFLSTEGSGPYSALIQSTDGAFYGTARNGGAHGFGTAFKMNASGTVTTLHSFKDLDGRSPEAALVEAGDGNFYGTTSGGGEYEAGTVFKMDPSGSVSVLHSFDDTNGSNPMAPVIQASDGKLYGTTLNGGEGYMGTVFTLGLNGSFAVLHSFDDIDEANPLSALTEGSDGSLYGTTSHVDGTIFKIDSLGSFTTLHYFRRFDDADGSTPYDGLVEATDGNFYGTTIFGGAAGQYVHQGTVFRMEPSGAVTIVHNFNRFDGGNPTVGVIQASDGNLYGSAPGGPFAGAGVIFRLSNAAVALNQVTPSSGPAAGGATLDLLGGGFSTNANVMVGGVTGADVAVLDPTFLFLSTPSLPPGTLNDVSITNPGSGLATATRTDAFFADFMDVPQPDPFHDYVEKIARNRVTAGCGGGNYCPQDSVTRAQMAVFLLKSKHGSAYVPPPCAGVFGDVPCPSTFADWIEQLAAEGITAGCGGGNYCPASPITRAQMAVFLLKTEHGSAFTPPACAGVFGDVPCPTLFADWIEQLAAEEITGGCGEGNYCPNNPNTRGQMAAFLVKTFHM